MTQPDADAVPSDAVPWRALFLLGSASFASSAGLRFCDPLLPTLADAFRTTPGGAAVVVTAYAVAYGGFQLVTGPLGDRYGKVRMIALGATLCGLSTLACAFATSLEQIAVFRFLAGLTGAAIIPNCLAFIGDTIPLAQRQAVLARYMIFMSSGAISGQAVGGLLADAFGWPAAFVLVGGFMIAAGLTLTLQLRTNPVLSRRTAVPSGGLAGSFRQILASGRTPMGRLVLATVTVEAVLYIGAFTFVGAHLHDKFDVSFTVIGIMTALAAVGAVAYSSFAPMLLARFSQSSLLALSGLAFSVSFLVIALSPWLWPVGLAIVLCGGAFALFHNALQIMATQINPEARGASIATFAFCFFAGQTLGVLCTSVMFDRWGPEPIFLAAAVLMPAMALVFRARLQAVQQA
jgi:MFS family permease